MKSVDSDAAELSRLELGYTYISRFWSDHDAKSLNLAIATLAPVLRSKSQERAVRARLGRGEAFILLGIHGRALMEYQAALDLQPESSYLKGIAQFEIGVCYDGMDSWSKAEIALNAFLSSLPGASLSAKDGSWKQSRPDFARLVIQNPVKANSLSGVDLVARAAFRRAILLHKLDRKAEAESLTNAISSAFPDLGAKLSSEIAASGGGH